MPTDDPLVRSDAERGSSHLFLNGSSPRCGAKHKATEDTKPIYTPRSPQTRWSPAFDMTRPSFPTAWRPDRGGCLAAVYQVVLPHTSILAVYGFPPTAPTVNQTTGGVGGGSNTALLGLLALLPRPPRCRSPAVPPRKWFYPQPKP